MKIMTNSLGWRSITYPYTNSTLSLLWLCTKLVCLVLIVLVNMDVNWYKEQEVFDTFLLFSLNS